MAFASGITRSSLEQADREMGFETEETSGESSTESTSEIEQQTSANLTARDARVLILYHWKKKSKPVDCLRDLQAVFGPIVQRSVIFKYYCRFKANNFNLDDEERTGRPPKLTDDELLHEIQLNPSICVEELADNLEVCEQTVRNHLHRLGYTVRLMKWVPHELNSFNKLTRTRVCQRLLEWYQREKDFLDNLVTCDEKWIYYSNNSRKQQLVAPGVSSRPAWPNEA